MDPTPSNPTQTLERESAAPESRPAVIVTGSSGLLGHPLCNRLAESGYEVFGFDRVGPPEPPKEHPHVHDIEFDATQYETVRGAISEVQRHGIKRVASVIHLAAYYDFSGSDSELYEKVTVEGTDRLLNALGALELDQFIFSSTMLVHAPGKVGELIDESSEIAGKWAYPKSKIRTERLICEGHPNVRSVLLRIAGVYNDWGLQPTLAQQIKRIYEKDFQSHFFPGDQGAAQSLVHLDDAVEALFQTVERRATIEAKTPILIGEPDSPSYEALQDAIGQLIHGQRWRTFFVPKLVAKVGAAVTDAVSGGEAFIKPFMVDMADDHYALDISRARNLLDWEPQHRLIRDLPQIVHRLLESPEAWYRENGLEPPDELVSRSVPELEHKSDRDGGES